MKKDILGVKINDVTSDEAVEIVENWLSKGGKHYIVTPNPEIVIMAQKDLQLKNIINNADLALPDGIGLKLTTDIENTSPGVDVMERLVKMASEKGYTTGFLGGKDDVAKKVAECLKRKFPKLKVVFAESGGKVDESGNSTTNYQLPATNLLFVAFGPPKQEKWIANNLSRIPVKVVMTVGGAFDVLSGRIPRAPKWIRHLGLEWLFRLIIQPWRIKRQLALVKYILLLLSWNNDNHQKV